MRRLLLCFGLLFGSFVLPTATFAASPGNVSGLSAHLENGQITLTWEAPAGDVSAYRIYHGQKSILGNEGAYDDFVTTAAQNTSFIMTELPPHPQIFFAVLAVNDAGEESASFIEEVQLDLGGAVTDGQKTEQVTASPSRKKREAETLGLLSAGATSPTTVEVTFSAPVRIPVERATEAFTVMSDEGKPLALRRLVLLGNIVTITTEPQVSARRYAIRAGGVVTGDSDAGTELPMDAERSIAVFPGFSGAGAVASVAEPNNAPVPQREELPSSGLPIVGMVLAGGAIAGWKRVKKGMMI